MGLDLVDRDADQPSHLAGMRRDDEVTAVVTDQRGRVVGERVQPVGVEHQRHRRLRHERAHHGASAGTLPETRSNRQHVAPRGQHGLDRVGCHRSVLGLGQPEGHVLGHQRPDHGLAGIGRRHRDQPGSGP